MLNILIESLFIIGNATIKLNILAESCELIVSKFVRLNWE